MVEADIRIRKGEGGTYIVSDETHCSPKELRNLRKQYENAMLNGQKMILQMQDQIKSSQISVDVNKALFEKVDSFMQKNKIPIFEASDDWEDKDYARYKDTLGTIVRQHPKAMENYDAGRGDVKDFFINKIMNLTGADANTKLAEKVVADYFQEYEEYKKNTAEAVKASEERAKDLDESTEQKEEEKPSE